MPNKVITFLKEVKTEMKKVNWPTKKEAINYTLIIIGITLALAIFLGGFDFIFTTLLNKIF